VLRVDVPSGGGTTEVDTLKSTPCSWAHGRVCTVHGTPVFLLAAVSPRGGRSHSIVRDQDVAYGSARMDGLVFRYIVIGGGRRVDTATMPAGPSGEGVGVPLVCAGRFCAACDAMRGSSGDWRLFFNSRTC
jgi:hypothetical protein